MPDFDISSLFNPGAGKFGFSPFQQSMGAGGLAGLVGGLFGNSGAPYQKAANEYEKYGNLAAGEQRPYAEAGTNALSNFKDWLSGMQNPSDFIGNLMGKYQQSPYAKYLTQQAIRGGQNAGSAAGLTGSSPLELELARQSAGIASGDMNQWLQNVLGINQQYGAGQQSLISGGQNAANSLSSIFSNMGNNLAEMAYGKGEGSNQDLMNTLAGAGQLAALFL